MSGGWYWRDWTLALALGTHDSDPEWLTKVRAIDAKLSDMSYKVVKQETLDTGYFLSTVWLGLDHQHGAGPPLIFETMVFSHALHDGPSDTCDMERYSTEEEARAGHERMKVRWNYAGLANDNIYISDVGEWPEEEK